MEVSAYSLSADDDETPSSTPSVIDAGGAWLPSLSSSWAPPLTSLTPALRVSLLERRVIPVSLRLLIERLLCTLWPDRSDQAPTALLNAFGWTRADFDRGYQLHLLQVPDEKLASDLWSDSKHELQAIRMFLNFPQTARLASALLIQHGGRINGLPLSLSNRSSPISFENSNCCDQPEDLSVKKNGQKSAENLGFRENEHKMQLKGSKKRVQCSVCLKSYCDRGALKIHVSAVHLRELHRCTVRGCPMVFTTRRSRNRHALNLNPKLHQPGGGSDSKTLISRRKSRAKRELTDLDLDLCDPGVIDTDRPPSVVDTFGQMPISKSLDQVIEQVLRCPDQSIIDCGPRCARRCTVCGKLFHNQYSLRTHLQNVHLRVLHPCPVEGCRARLPSKRSRDRHAKNKNLHAKLAPPGDADQAGPPSNGSSPSARLFPNLRGVLGTRPRGSTVVGERRPPTASSDSSLRDAMPQLSPEVCVSRGTTVP